MPIDAEVLLEFENFGGFIREVSANISNGGMFIKTRYLKPVGTVVHFQFRLADHMELIRGTGTVVWTRWRDQGPGAPAGMGIQFLDVDEPSQLLIAAIVEQHLQHGGAVFDLGTAAREGEGEPPPADAGNWGAAARAEDAEDRLPEIDFGALPGFEPGAPTSSPGWTGASQPEGAAPSEEGLSAVAEAVAPGVAAAGSEARLGTGERGEASPGRRPTAPWPTLWTEPEAAPPSDVLTPPEPPPAATEVLSRPEPPRWTPPAIPDRKPFSMAGPVERSGGRIGLLVAVLVVAVVGGAGYYFRGPLLALVGRGASPSPPPAAAPRATPETAKTPAASPSPVPFGQGAGTLHDEVARTVAASPQASPVPAEPATDVATTAPAASPAQSPLAVAPVTRPAASPAGFGGLVRVRWQANAEGLLVLLECDGPLDSSRFDTTRLEGADPRVLVRLLGVRRPFDQTRIAVGVGPLKQIRIGYHAGARAELYVVLDLASSAAKAVSVEPQGSVLRIQLAGK